MTIKEKKRKVIKTPLIKKVITVQFIKKIKSTQFIKSIHLILIIINSDNILNNKTEENNIKSLN